EARLRRGLALTQLAREEGLAVSEEEVEAEARAVQERLQVSAAIWEQIAPQVVADIRSRILADRALRRLVEIVRGEAEARPEPAGSLSSEA
ncbi:MAG: hypothetical protein C4312_04995, partial [Thermoflexus sp.]